MYTPEVYGEVKSLVLDYYNLPHIQEPRFSLSEKKIVQHYNLQNIAATAKVWNH